MKCFIDCEQALISAWESDQRVKALKIAIQVSLVTWLVQLLIQLYLFWCKWAAARMDTFCYPYEDICWWYGDSLVSSQKYWNP